MNERKKIEIMVCCHKPDYYRDDEGFLPIHVGRARSNHQLPMVGDDSGENISSQNPNFCELTAHYWYWKNRPAAEYVGLAHYRRYFLFDQKPRYGEDCINMSTDKIKSISGVGLPANVDKLMSDCDIILAQPRHYFYSLRVDYCAGHIAEDYRALGDCISDRYPQYTESWNYVMKRNNKLSHYNMFLMRNEEFERYSKWLFDILFEVRKRVKISEYPAQARIFGYMAERLLNVYVHHNKLRVKYRPIVKVCDDPNRPYWRNLYTTLKTDLVSRILIHDLH